MEKTFSVVTFKVFSLKVLEQGFEPITGTTGKAGVL